MVTVNVHEAKTHLSRLLAEVEAGQDVVIARNGKPVAKLVPYAPEGKRQFGSMAGLIELDESFFDPLPEEELAAWEGDCRCGSC
jgi:prevent-host-death family protein